MVLRVAQGPAAAGGDGGGAVPGAGARCAAFLRHKDLLFSPRLLKAHNIDYVQARSAGAAAVCMLGPAPCHLPATLLFMYKFLQDLLC